MFSSYHLSSNLMNKKVRVKTRKSLCYWINCINLTLNALWLLSNGKRLVLTQEMTDSEW